MAYGRNTVNRVFLLGLVLAFLPIYVYAVLGLMVHIGWIVTDYAALHMAWWGILLAVSFFGVGLFAVALYMAYKNSTRGIE